MRPLKAFVPKVVAVASVVGLWVALAPGCQGPDEFFRFTADAGSPGTAGSGPTGTAGTGVAGTTGGGGTGGSATGLAGSNAGGGAGSGNAGTTGTAGTGTTGQSGAIGSGGSQTGSAGAVGSGGRGGTTTGSGGGAGNTGTAGSTGAAGTSTGGSNAGSGGRGGATTGTGGTTTGTGGSATGGSTGAAGTGTGGGQSGSAGVGGSATGGAGGGAANRIQVVAQCQAATSMQEVKVTFKIFNPDSVAKQWSDIKVRYYFTPTVMSPPSVTFDYAPGFPAAMVTTNPTTTYVEIGFAAGSGTVAAFDNVTGSKEMQLRFFNYSSTSWNASQADDYSYKSCAGGASTTAYTDRPTMPGYYQGQLAWGSEPPQ
jgi:hypothetical protein